MKSSQQLIVRTAKATLSCRFVCSISTRAVQQYKYQESFTVYTQQQKQHQHFFSTTTNPDNLPSAGGSNSELQTRSSDGVLATPINFDVASKVEGNESQIVTVSLEPGQVLRAESGSMMYMTEGVDMNTTSGGGVSAGFKRMLTGQNVFISDYSYNGEQGTNGVVCLGTDFPSKIIRLNVNEYGGKIICQQGALLCASHTIDIEMEFTKKFSTGFFGGEGFVLQGLVGEGDVFVKAGGTLIRQELAEGEQLRISSGCLVAFSNGVEYDIEMLKGYKNVLFGGEGLFVTTLTGPGTIWLQGQPPQRMISEIARRVPSGGGIGLAVPIGGMGGGDGGSGEGEGGEETSNVFSLKEQEWRQLGGIIEPQPGAFDHATDDYDVCLRYGGDNYLSMSHNGRVLAVGYVIYGDYRCYYDTSAVEIYEYDEFTDQWKIRGFPIIEQGSVTSLSGDGNILAVGKWNDVGGAVNVFEYDAIAKGWKLMEQIENDFDGTFEDQYFGYSISLSDDANTLVVGHPGKFFSTSYYMDDDYAEEAPGITYIFRRNGMGNYVKKGDPISGDYAENSGYKVSVSENGEIVAMLSPSNYARIYEYKGNEWVQLGSDIAGSFTSVSLSPTGIDLAMDRSGVNSGYVIYSYDNEVENWKEVPLGIDSLLVEFGPDKQLVKYGEINFKASKRAFSVSSNGQNVAESEGDFTRVFTLDGNSVKPPRSNSKKQKSSKGTKSGKGKGGKKSSKTPKSIKGKGGQKSSKMPKSSKRPKVGKGKGGKKSPKMPKSSKGPKGGKGNGVKKSSKMPKSSR